jgi:hypothetical protein
MAIVGDTILTCLKDYIGLISCEVTEPGSGLFINSLPGISNELLQAITDYEAETYKATWDEIQQETILLFRSALLAELNKCYQINKMPTVECIACENKELLAVALWYLLGSMVMNTALKNWNNSRYSTIDRESVEEIRAEYRVSFERELTNAVQGIDVEKSDCLQKETTCLQQNGRIHYRESLM